MTQSMQSVRLASALGLRRVLSKGAPNLRSLSSHTGSTLDPAEVAKFAALSRQWWRDTGGPFAGLHRLNAVRVPLVRDAALRLPAAGAAAGAARGPLAGLDVLDVGCGGGILSEALARLGARVTGVDAAAANVAAAELHAELDPAAFAGRLRYRCCTAEQLADEAAAAGTSARFDAVVCSEVAEHVADVGTLARALAALVRPGGCAVVSTINRTVPSFFLAIVAAEYVLRIVPAGTHEWARFVAPDELADAFAAHGLGAEEVRGLFYDPLRREWSLSGDTSVNYVSVFRRAPEPVELQS